MPVTPDVSTFEAHVPPTWERTKNPLLEQEFTTPPTKNEIFVNMTRKKTFGKS